jgi:RHS repeat-associated protein
MVFDRDYDPATGFLRRLSYPRTRQGGGVDVTLDYQNGKLRTVRDARTSSPHWQRLSANALGETTLERYGNNVESSRNYYDWGGLSELRTGASAALQNWRLYYDGNRNVVARVDLRQGMTEQFGYDGLDRVTQASFVNGTAAVLPTTPLPACNPPNTTLPPTFAPCATTQYDEIGNITYRSDGGFYSYGAVNTSNVTRAHAVSNIQWVSTNRAFRYDPNGNALSNGKETFTYTAFGKPRTITGTDAMVATFQYDAQENRARQQLAGTDMLYAGTLYQRETASNGTVTHRYFIEAEGRVVAEVATIDDNRPVRTLGQPLAGPIGVLATTTVSYYHDDFLGSIEVVTDKLGNLVSRRSNDVFGRIRSEDWRAGATTPPSERRRGYTGNEEDYRFGLVNMKGRLYDPYAARMLQPDPLLQAPLFSQSLNRYSYVWNNPLTLTDPTGLGGEANFSPAPDYSYGPSYDSDVSTPAAADPGSPVTCYVGSPDPAAPKPETAKEGGMSLGSSAAPRSSPDDLMSKDPRLMATQYSETVDSAPLLPNIPFTNTSCTVGTECVNGNAVGTLTIGLVGSFAGKDEKQSPGEAITAVGTGRYWDTDSGEFGSYKVVGFYAGVRQETGASVEIGWFNSANDFSGNTVAFGLTGTVKGKGGGVNINFAPSDWHVQGGSIDISLTGPNKLGGTIQSAYTILNPLGNDGTGAPSYPPGTFLGVLMPQPDAKVDFSPP